MRSPIHEAEPQKTEGKPRKGGAFPHCAAAEPHWWLSGEQLAVSRAKGSEASQGSTAFSSAYCLLLTAELGLAGPGSQLHSVLLFLQKLNRHHAILLEPAIKLAAINAKRRSSLNLIAAKLLQY